MKNEHITFLKVAGLFAKNSTCYSRQTGCCIVKDGRSIATGYNGVPGGCIHCEDIWIEEQEIWDNISEYLEKYSSNVDLKSEFVNNAMRHALEHKDINNETFQRLLKQSNKKIFTREAHHEWSKENELHAEANALIFCAKNGISVNGATMYMTISPCVNCALLIIQSGIKTVFYQDKYDLSDGISKLSENGISVSQITLLE